MKNKLQHEFNRDRVCIHCGVAVKQAANTAGDPNKEDIRLEFMGGVSDGLTSVMQFPSNAFADGDSWLVSKGDRLHTYRAKEAAQRCNCGIRAVYLLFVKIKAAR